VGHVACMEEERKCTRFWWESPREVHTTHLSSFVNVMIQVCMLLGCLSMFLCIILNYCVMVTALQWPDRLCM
jgi:hypothetical protein